MSADAVCACAVALSLDVFDTLASTLTLPPCPFVPLASSGGSVGPSGRRSSSPVASAGSSDGLGGSVVSVSDEWWRDALHALMLVFVGRSVSRAVSSVLPPLIWPMHSSSSNMLWGVVSWWWCRRHRWPWVWCLGSSATCPLLGLSRARFRAGVRCRCSRCIWLPVRCCVRLSLCRRVFVG